MFRNIKNYFNKKGQPVWALPGNSSGEEMPPKLFIEIPGAFTNDRVA